jgi:hypothetical protein
MSSSTTSPERPAAPKRDYLIATVVVVGALAVAVLVLVFGLQAWAAARYPSIHGYEAISCRLTSCGTAAMTVAGWSVWAIGTAALIGLGSAKVVAPKWVFRALLLPGLAVIGYALMFAGYDFAYRVEDIVPLDPPGRAFVAGTTAGGWAFFLSLFATLPAASWLNDPERPWRQWVGALGAPAALLGATLALALVL